MSLNTVTETETPVARRVTAPANAAVKREETGLARQGKRLQELLDQAGNLPDPNARALLRECLQSLLELHGEGLARILELVEEVEEEKGKVFNRLIGDEVVRGLLLVHGLHPLSLETRLHQALDKVRPYMESHGGNVELISLENDVARLRLQGACKTCPSSAITIELAVRHAIEEVCPDLMGLELEGVTAPANKTNGTHKPAAQTPKAVWVVVEGVDQLHNGDAKIMEVAGVSLIICSVKGNLYAYRNLCPGCHKPFGADALKDGWLGCGQGHFFDAQHAGVGEGESDLYLHPHPLVIEGGQVKISVG